MVERDWAQANDDELSALPLRALRLKLADSPLQPRVERLYAELARAGMRFRPHVWFSTDWFSPDSVAGIAVPFYLGHPRLARLERKHHVRAEGSGEHECMRLLRHEAGHAIDTAFGLARGAAWRKLFGPRNTSYGRTYRANPLSNDFVRHLPRWYAQSHPAEDFAETFAVWLSSGKGGGGLGAVARRKLELVGELVQGVCTRRPRGVLRERPYSLARAQGTVGEHYLRKRKAFEREPTLPYEAFLQRYAVPAGAPGRSPLATYFAEHRLRVHTALKSAGANRRYDVDQVLDGMALHARMRALVWKGRRRPSAKELAGGVRTSWNLLRRGSASLPR